jgi:N-methylhydantoinase A
VSAHGRLPKLPSERIEPQAGALDAARTGSRPVYCGRPHGWLETPVYDRDRLGSGARVHGPAVLEQLDSTTVLGPGQAGTVQPHGHLIVELPG